MDLMDYRRKIIANSPHLKSASGDIVSFSDGADLPLKSLIVDIDPVQSGTGDPSPSNVRPISGWDAVKVTRTGKNGCGELEINSWRESSPVGSAYDDMKYSAPKRARSVSLVPVTYPMTISIASGYKYALIVFDENEKYLGASSFMNWQSTSYTRTSAWYGNGAYIAFVIKRNDEANITEQDLENCHLQIELGSTATPYEPYNGVNVSIDLGRTVYGGTLNPLTGELVVTHRIRHITNADSFASSGNSVYMACADCIKTNNYVGKIICDKLDTATRNSGSMGIFTVTGYNDPNNTYPTQNWLYFRVAESMSSTIMKNWLAEVGGIDVVYELATPQTYHLDPQTVRSLYGQNNIWADTGNVALEYWAHQ